MPSSMGVEPPAAIIESPTEAARVLQTAWGTAAPSARTVRHWFHTGSLAVSFPCAATDVLRAAAHLRDATVPTKRDRMLFARASSGESSIRRPARAASCGAPAWDGPRTFVLSIKPKR